MLEPGDSIMADRDFTLKDDLPEIIAINIPPFLNGESQLSLNNENETRQKVSVRVHVESAIERVKNFKTLQSMAPELNKRWVLSNYLANFLPRLLTGKKTTNLIL